MSVPDHYFTIEKDSFAEYRDRGSKFMAYAFPMLQTDTFKSRLQDLKKEHPKAVHHCFAWRLGWDGNQFRVSDDGEPSGTAGKPILGQLDSKQLTDTGVIVVRYFGGTLLGVPGLIQAYKSAASMALQLVPSIQKSVEILYSLQFDYTRLNEVMTIIKQSGCSVVGQEMQLFCLLQIGIPKARLEEVLHKLKDIHTLEVRKV